MADWSYACFEVYPRENEDGTLAECPIYTLADIIISMTLTNFQGFISPLHAPDTLADHVKGGKKHFHVAIETGGRLTQKSLQKTLDSCGVRYVNRLIIRLDKQGYNRYCRYLLHRTHDSRDKQQFSPDALAYPINKPLRSYASIFEEDYVRDVMKLIQEQNINNTVVLMDMVYLCLEDYKDLVWRDLNKWSTFFMADRIKLAYVNM